MEARGNGALIASIHFYQQSVKASDWKEKRTLLEEAIAAAGWALGLLPHGCVGAAGSVTDHGKV